MYILQFSFYFTKAIEHKNIENGCTNKKSFVLVAIVVINLFLGKLKFMIGEIKKVWF